MPGTTDIESKNASMEFWQRGEKSAFILWVKIYSWQCEISVCNFFACSTYHIQRNVYVCTLVLNFNFSAATSTEEERERKSFLFLTIHVTRDDKLALDLGSIPQQSRNNKALKMITRNLINGNACACYTLVFVSSGVCRQCRTFYSIRNRIKRRFSSPYPDSFSLIHVLWPRWLLLLRIFRNTQNAHTETTFM